MTRYTEDHEWVRLEGDVAVVGVSAYAAEQLGDVVYVELPAIGAKFAKGADMAVVESAKVASDVYAPISGEIVAVNDALVDAPETVNAGAEAVGWFVKLKPDNVADLEQLMDAGADAKFVEGLS
jgi:glycine cleavage system H protein